MLVSSSSSALQPYKSEPIGVYYIIRVQLFPCYIREGLIFFNFWQFYFFLFTGVSTNNRPNYLTLRVFFGFLTLFALNVNTIYTSKLITVFTGSVRDHQIDTIEEILRDELTIGESMRVGIKREVILKICIKKTHRRPPGKSRLVRKRWRARYFSG